jgi:SPP1 gp7 family putative phage head morphogenesis protein
MTSIPDKIRSRIIGQTVNLTRYEAQLQQDVLAMLYDLGADLIKGLMGAGLDTPRTDWQRARLRAMLEEAKATIDSTYADIGTWHAEEMAGLIQVSSKGIATAMNEAIGADLMIPPKWTKEQLRAIASDVMTEGAPSSIWWDRQASGLLDDFSDAMRKGMMRGENITQLRDRIMGQNIPGVNAVGKVDLRTIPVEDRGVFWAARRNAEALVRTSVISTANTAHMEAYKANADIMGGLEWLSTLDNRTTPICRAMDGLRWTMDLEPIGHDRPYPGATAHWGCRSTTMPVTKTWEQLAKEAGGNTAMAKELDKIPLGQRASMGGPVSGDLTYEKWFAQQSEKQQKDILGPGKFDMWQKGKLGFTDMVNQNGNPLNISQLEAGQGSLSATSGRSAGLTTALTDWERKYVNKNREYGAIFDPDGNLLMHKKGKKSSVPLENSDINLLKDNIFTHNHPSNGSFSFADVSVAMKYDVAEMRAAGEGGRTYVMQRPASGWPSGGVTARNQIHSAYTSTKRKLLQQLDADVAANRITWDGGAADFYHRLWLDVIASLNIDLGYGVSIV